MAFANLRWLYVPVLMLLALLCGLQPIAGNSPVASDNSDMGNMNVASQPLDIQMQTFNLFFEPGCVQCGKIIPTFRSVAKEIESARRQLMLQQDPQERTAVTFHEFDVSADGKARQRADVLGLQRLPTLMYFENGSPVGSLPPVYLQLQKKRMSALLQGVLDGNTEYLQPWEMSDDFKDGDLKKVISLSDDDLSYGYIAGEVSEPPGAAAAAPSPTAEFVRKEIAVLIRVVTLVAFWGMVVVACLSPVALAVAVPLCCTGKHSVVKSLDDRCHGRDAFLARRACHSVLAAAVRLRAAVWCPRRVGRRLRRQQYAAARTASSTAVQRWRQNKILSVKGKKPIDGVLSVAWMRAKSEVYRGLISRRLQGRQNDDGHFVIDLQRQPFTIEEVAIPLTCGDLIRVAPSAAGGAAVLPTYTRTFPSLVSHIYSAVQVALNRANLAAHHFLAEESGSMANGSLPADIDLSELSDASDSSGSSSSHGPPSEDAIKVTLLDPRNYRVPLLSVTAAPDAILSGGSTEIQKKRLRAINGLGSSPKGELPVTHPRKLLAGVHLEFAGLHLTSGGEVWVLWQPVKRSKDPNTSDKRVIPDSDAPLIGRDSAEAQENIVENKNEFQPTGAVDAVRRNVWSKHYSTTVAPPSLELYTPIMQLWVTAATAASSPFIPASSKPPSPRPVAATVAAVAMASSPAAVVPDQTPSKSMDDSSSNQSGPRKRSAPKSPRSRFRNNTGGWRAKRRSDGVVRCLAYELAPTIQKLSDKLLAECQGMYLPLRREFTGSDETKVADPAVAIHVLDPVHSLRVWA